MVQTVALSGLGSGLILYHGVHQDRSIDAMFALTLADSTGLAMQGLLASHVQAFFMVRAARVSLTRWRLCQVAMAAVDCHVVFIQVLRDKRIARAVFLAVGFFAIL